MRCPHRTVAHGKVAGAGRLRTAASQGPSGGWNVRSHPACNHPIEADRKRSCRSLVGGNGRCRRNPRHGERKNPAREVPDAQHGNPNADDRRVSAFLRQGHETDHAPCRRLAQDSGGRNPVCAGGRRASILPDRHRLQRTISWTVSRTHPDAAILVAGPGTTGEFIGILQAFHGVLSQHFQTPEFQQEAMAFRFYCATGGLIGYLTKILRRSVWHAAATEKREITLEDLCNAHEKAVWCGRIPQRLPRPFARNFKLIVTVDLLREVSLIGTVHVPADESDIPPAKPARSERRKPGGESAAAWLVAR